MVKLLWLVVYFVVIPVALGSIYAVLNKTKQYYIDRIWAIGFAILLAGFSAWYKVNQDIRIGWKTEDCKALFLFLFIVSILLVGVIIAQKKHIEFPQWGGLKKHYIWPILLVVLLFILSHFLLKMDYEGIQEAYITCYSADMSVVSENVDLSKVDEYRSTTFLSFNVLGLYLSVDEILGIRPERFLTIIIPILHLMLSFGCYGFLAEQFNIKEEKQYQYLLLVYALSLITVFQEKNYLFGLYTNFWEPMTLFVGVYLPFQFGMMIYIEEKMVHAENGSAFGVLFWVIVAYLLGYLFPIKEPFILLAPEILGVFVGLIRRYKNASNVL